MRLMSEILDVSRLSQPRRQHKQDGLTPRKVVTFFFLRRCPEDS